MNKDKPEKIKLPKRKDHHSKLSMKYLLYATALFVLMRIPSYDAYGTMIDEDGFVMFFLLILTNAAIIGFSFSGLIHIIKSFLKKERSSFIAIPGNFIILIISLSELYRIALNLMRYMVQ